MIIRAAQLTDLPSIMAVEELSFPDFERWTESAWTQELDASHSDRAVFVVESEPRSGEWDDSPFAPHLPPTGAASGASDTDVSRVEQRTVDAVASFRRVQDTADIFRLMTAKGVRRLGLATALVQRGLEWADGAGADRALLEVRSTNSSARALYARLGFESIHERKNYYGTGVDAIVMELPLNACAATGAATGRAGIGVSDGE